MGCIYLYTNKINGKQYVGQTVRPIRKRHSQHLSQKDSYFDRALHKYGIENFTLEILEDNINDIDELNRLEIYYIEKYDTFNTGYNLTRGGSNGTRFSIKDRDIIVDLLLNTKLSFAEIAQKTDYGIDTVSEINRGETLPRDDIEYPIRTRRCDAKYTEEDFLAVVDLLKTTNLSFDEIATATDTNFYFIADVNQGRRAEWIKKYQIETPIRKNVKRAKVSVELAKKVIAALKKRDMSADEIGESLGIPGYTVGSINRGKHSICKQIPEDYPIRKTPYKNPFNKLFSRQELNKVLDLLFLTDLSMEEIGKRVGARRSTIAMINQGRNYYHENTMYKFPLRQNKDYNIPIFSSVKE